MVARSAIIFFVQIFFNFYISLAKAVSLIDVFQKRQREERVCYHERAANSKRLNPWFFADFLLSR